MCLYRLHTFACGHEILKIHDPCPNASINAAGLLFCRLNPHAHPNTVVPDKITYGPGVCSCIHCHWLMGRLPDGSFGGEGNVGGRYVVDEEPYDVDEHGNIVPSQRNGPDVLCGDAVELMQAKLELINVAGSSLSNTTGQSLLPSLASNALEQLPSGSTQVDKSSVDYRSQMSIESTVRRPSSQRPGFNRTLLAPNEACDTKQKQVDKLRGPSNAALRHVHDLLLPMRTSDAISTLRQDVEDKSEDRQ
ncbi:hypothetical protein B0A49_12934 [Cryomyces minteri]|uniref:Uncharacterized protein n=1 Tax=Cryomyces minteri TaxID=331657 RepID=A0A4U0VFM7_9PEZI|nr:hypothetical protein B0A49_12934 [Cryomyces minteri]